MEYKFSPTKAGLFLIFCCLPCFAMAQANKNADDRELLFGTWIWEEASIADPNAPISFDLVNDYIKFYDEIEIENDSVSLTDSEGTVEVKYEVDGNYLGIDLPLEESIIAEWAVLDNKLYMEFDSEHPYDISKKVKVLLVYRKK